MYRKQVMFAQKDINLAQVKLACLCLKMGRVKDDEVEVIVFLNFWPLVLMGGILKRERVELELHAQFSQFLLCGVLQVNPEEDVIVVFALTQLIEVSNGMEGLLFLSQYVPRIMDNPFLFGCWPALRGAKALLK